MDDKTIMENLLCNTKGACDLYMHGTIEAASPNVHQTFSTALNSELSIQDSVYQKMTQKGWYPMEQAPQDQVQKIRQKYSSSC